MTDPLTDEEIEDCRAWVSGVYFTGTEPGDFSDIDTLRWLATIDALRAEVERLREENAFLLAGSDASGEIERQLRAEVERLNQRGCDFQAAAMLDVGGQGDPDGVEPRHVEHEITTLRAEVERLTTIADSTADRCAVAEDTEHALRAEVKTAKADALREAAEAWCWERNKNHPYGAEGWLLDRAAAEEGDDD